MLSILLIAAASVATSQAIVCLPNMCDGVDQPLLSCQGGVIKNGGFCGCTDICAKVEGEACMFNSLFGVMNTARCDDGLECTPKTLEGHLLGHHCTQIVHDSQENTGDDLLMSKKSVPRCQTACQRKSLACTMSMVVYEGQWFAKCDFEGNFLSEQCDNTNHCFCVHHLTGEVDESSKVLGAAQC